MAFEIQNTRIINLSAKMNNRQNNETLEVDPNGKGLELVSLTNGDLFNTNTLASRLGTVDICGGIVNATVSINCVMDMTNSPPVSNISTVDQSSAARKQIEPETFNHQGLLIIPSGNFNIYSGNITVTPYYPHVADPNTTAGIDPYIMQMNLYEMDQASLPASGVSAMVGINNTGIHNIGLSGTYNFNFKSPSIPATPVAYSNSGLTFDTGPFSGSSNNWYADRQSVPFQFEAPYELKSGSVYFLNYRFYGTTQVNGVDSADFFVQVQQTSFNALYNPNSVLAQTVAQTSTGSTINPTNLGPGTKGWVSTCLNEYQGASYLLVDIPNATADLCAPLVSGQTFSGAPSNENVAVQINPYGTAGVFNGAVHSPSIDTTTVEFGQVIHVPSGVNTLFGQYFYAVPNDRTGWSNYTRNKAAISGNGYNLGYIGNLSTINTHTGTLANGNYTVTDRTVIATYSGNYIFDDNLNNQTGNNTQNSANYNLHKIYALYDNPITISGTGVDMLLSFKFYDFQTGGDYTDYSYRNITTGFFAPTTQFQSFIQTGYTDEGTYLSGSYVTNYSDDGSTFISPSGSIFVSPTGQNLSCGLINVQSGNGITSVYDYRVGDSRTQKIVYTIRDQVRIFDLATPSALNHTVIHTGASISNDYKWSHSTFQNDLFSHQYSQTSGLYWDQIYTGTSSNYMQLHGLRPAFTAIETPAATGTVGTGVGASYLTSGTDIQIILGTTLNSGGIRASTIAEVSTTGTFSYVRLSGTDIFNPSGSSQYKFDAFPGQSTYVFTTESSGNTFYLAELYSGTSVQTLSLVDNPILNTPSFPLYIKNVSGPSSTGTIVLTQQVPQVILYPQEYLTNQIDVPKFKKTIVYKNMLIGIGDPNNPSRLWYSEIQGPNIYGTDTNFYGFYDVDNDNGQELTGIEIFKDYLIIFKQNSTYRATFTANPGDPLDFFKLSSTIGNLGIFDTVTTDYGIFGLSQFGPILASYAGADTIGDEILPYYAQLDHTSLIFSTAIHDRERQQIYWSISNQNLSADRNIGLTYSYAEKAWTIRENGMWLAGAANGVGDSDNFTLLYCGDVLGQIFALDGGVADEDVLFNDGNGVNLTQNVTLIAETPWLNFGNSQNLKQLKNLRLNCDSSEQRLKIEVYFDQNSTTPKYTRYLNMNVPVINRVISLSQNCRTCKFVITSVGTPSRVKLNSMQIAYMDLGPRINI